MKISIISDTHDNLANLGKFFDFCKKENIKIIIHCGDVCKGETLEEIEKNFKKIYLCFGNADIKESFLNFSQNPKIKIFEEFGEVKIDKIKIGFSHDPNLAKNFFETKNYDFVFFGHTHQPFLKEKEGKFLANPGNLAGLYFKASFATLDTKTKKIELKILEKLIF